MNLVTESVGFAVVNEAGDNFGIYITAEHALRTIKLMTPYRPGLYVKEVFVQRPAK
jgi:hypothetical protein